MGDELPSEGEPHRGATHAHAARRGRLHGRYQKMPRSRRVLDLVDIVGPEAGRQVLPAAVADDADDRAARPSSRRSRAQVWMTAPEETPAKMPSSAARRRVMTSESRLETSSFRSSRREIEDRRDEAVVEATQAAHRIALQRLAGDDLDLGAVLLEPLRRSPSGCRPVPRPATKTSISGQSRMISSAVALVVGARVRGVAVLERHVERRSRRRGALATSTAPLEPNSPSVSRRSRRRRASGAGGAPG